MKPRVLIPISIQFSIRYVVRTGFLEKICQYCDPIILLFFNDENFEHELNDNGIEFIHIPEVNFSDKHRHIRRKIDYWWQKKYLRSSNTAIDNYRNVIIANKNLKRKAISLLMRLYYTLKHDYLGGIKTIIDEEEILFRSNSYVKDLKNRIVSLNPDAYISLAPFILGEEIVGRLVKEIGIPCCASILSFDNLLRANRVPIVFNNYFLWNEYNRKELIRGYPKASSSVIKIIGAPQFDFYYDKSYVWDETTWRKRLKLPDNRPIILFAAGYFKIVPNEHQWLRQLDDAIENGEIKGNPIILFRIHPVDPLDRWKPILENAKNIVFDEPWKTPKTGKGRANVKRIDIEKLVSTLYHTQVHVNTSSTMTVDGAIFDKPQIGLAFDDQPGRKYDQIVKDLYKREHFIPIVKSGGLELAHSRKELVSLINSAFEDPGRLSSERKILVREICTYGDGKGSERLGRAFKSFLKSNNLI